jgi:YHS domain-containing protein
MAHQTDMHVVHRDFKSEASEEEVVDPVCGMKMHRKDSRHVLFRKDETIYFCSRRCEEQFLEPPWKKKAG